MMSKASCAHRTRLIAGFFCACLPLNAYSGGITITEVKKPVMCKNDKINTNCAYVAHLWIKIKRGCPECAWTQKKI